LVVAHPACLAAPVGPALIAVAGRQALAQAGLGADVLVAGTGAAVPPAQVVATLLAGTVGGVIATCVFMAHLPFPARGAFFERRPDELVDLWLARLARVEGVEVVEYRTFPVDEAGRGLNGVGADALNAGIQGAFVLVGT